MVRVKQASDLHLKLSDQRFMVQQKSLQPYKELFDLERLAIRLGKSDIYGWSISVPVKDSS